MKEKIITVSLREQLISPKKARLMVDLVRGKNAEKALSILKFTNKKSARLVGKLLKSGLDACKQKDYSAKDLYLCEAVCNEGRRLKRFAIGARGRSRGFTKRYSHIKISLCRTSEEDDSKKKEKAKPEKVKKNGTKS